jgi:DNA-binding transcriptional ArsR family regulator
MESKLKIDVPKTKLVARKFKAITHPVRTAIILMLIENGEMEVKQIIKKMNLHLADISHHFALLTEYRILKRVRQDNNTLYSVDIDLLNNIVKIADELVKMQ